MAVVYFVLGLVLGGTVAVLFLSAMQLSKNKR